MSETPHAIVEAFIGKWNAMDVPGALAMMADDTIWDNIPMGPAKGLAEMQREFA